jgi:hypothetical protein
MPVNLLSRDNFIRYEKGPWKENYGTSDGST